MEEAQEQVVLAVRQEVLVPTVVRVQMVLLELTVQAGLMVAQEPVVLAAHQEAQE